LAIDFGGAEAGIGSTAKSQRPHETPRIFEDVVQGEASLI
jgi:hypothetical protein